MFGRKKKTNVVEDKRRIYEPERDFSDEYPYSSWRKPLEINEVNPRGKYTMLSIEHGSLKFLDIVNVVLCVLILLGITKLVFFTTYEKTVLVDGTELSCLVLEDGTVTPYEPPKAPSVPMPKVPLIKQNAAPISPKTPSTNQSVNQTVGQNTANTPAQVPNTQVSSTQSAQQGVSSQTVAPTQPQTNTISSQ